MTLSGKALAAGTDYTVSFSGNTDPGQATWTVTFAGNYGGVLSGSFAITTQREDRFVDGTRSGVKQSGLDQVLASLAPATPGAKSIVVGLAVSEASAAGGPVTAYAKRYSTFGIGYTAAAAPPPAAGASPGAVAKASASPKTADGTMPYALGMIVLGFAGGGLRGLRPAPQARVGLQAAAGMRRAL